VFLIYQEINAQYNITEYNEDIAYGVEVNTYNGNVFYQRNDLSLPTIGMDIGFTFSYNSRNSEMDLGYGKGWTSNYNWQYEIDENGDVELQRGDGNKHKFTPSGGGFNAQPGSFENWTEYAPGQFLRTLRDGTKYYFDNPNHKKLTKIEDRNGNFCSFSYNANGELIQVESSCGTSVNLTWTNGHLTEIVDDSETPTRTYQYQFSADGLMLEYTDPLGNLEAYDYDSDDRLTTLTNKNGNDLNITYNDFGSGEIFTTAITTQTLSFDVANYSTYFTEIVGDTTQVTTYIYNNEKQLVQKTGNCCGFNTTYEYDTDNNITKMTDANGNSTFYTFNSNGQPLTETDALGNSRSMTYESVYNKMASMTDKNGNTTTYIYDANGNLIQTNKPLNIVESSTYNSDGTIASSTDGNGNVTSYSFDACGQMTSVNEPLGRSTLYTYNNRGELIEETNPNGCSTVYEYDQLSRMTSTVDAVNNTTLYGYDALGNRTSMTDPNGNITTYDFDELNRVIATNKPLGITTKYTWDQLNRIGMTDPNGNEAIFNFDGRNLLVSQVDAVGNTTSFDYDDKGNRLSMTDPNGNITSYEYDAIDQMTKMTDAIGGIVTYQYDPNGNQIAVTDQEGNTTQIAYDALDRSIQVTNAIGGITTQIYDANNNQIAVTDQNNNTTNFDYDALDRMVSMTDALGNVVTTDYDLVGNQLVNTDANGNATTNEYDCINRLVNTTNAEGETITFGYDNNSNQTSISTPNGNVINYTFDAINRATNITDNIGEVATMTYDLNSNTLSQTDGNGNTTTMTYDAINRVTQQTDALGESSTLSYDDNSNLLSQTDRNGNVVAMEYDALNRSTKTTDALGNETLSFYDGVSNLIELKDAKSSSTNYEFDGLYRMTKETYADGTTKEYTYDAVGNVLTRKDNNGAVTNYVYDAIYRLLNRDYPDSNDDAFTYDPAGRMLTAANENAAITYSYDQANRILGENLNGKSTAYGYDILNSKRTLTYPSGRTTEENYDQRSRLEILKDAGTDLATFQYDLGNRITQKNYANGVQSFLNYNANNWTTQITHNNGNNFADLFYTHDKEGNKASTEFLHKLNHSEKYEYDAKYRLTNFQKGTLTNGNIAVPATQSQYNLDALGNRIDVDKDGNTTTYSSNEMNEYTQIATPSIIVPTNNDNGNLIEDGQGKFFEYDYENRLIAIAIDGGITFSIAYKYDPLGRRIQKAANGILTNYYYDGARVIEEQDETNATVTTFIYGTWIDDVINMQKAGEDYFYHQNHLGSVVAITNATGNLAEQYEYDAFGKVTIYNASFDTLSSSTIDNPYLFTGRRLDPETGLYYYRARHYDSETGRFMQRDPLGYVDGMNLFEYVGGNVVNWVDPLGYFKSALHRIIRDPAMNKAELMLQRIFNTKQGEHHEFRKEFDLGKFNKKLKKLGDLKWALSVKFNGWFDFERCCAIVNITGGGSFRFKSIPLRIFPQIPFFAPNIIITSKISLKGYAELCTGLEWKFFTFRFTAGAGLRQEYKVGKNFKVFAEGGVNYLFEYDFLTPKVIQNKFGFWARGVAEVDLGLFDYRFQLGGPSSDMD